MNLTDGRILVTGATGFLGGALARRLVAEGAQVRALVRTPNKAAALRELGVEIAQGDLGDEVSIQAAVDDCALVFHVAVDYTTPQRQQAVNVDGTRRVAQAAARAGAARLIHVSSIAAYGSVQAGSLNEQSPALPGGYAYGRTKTQGEAVVQAVGAETGLSWAISRPGMIYGAGGEIWTKALFQLAKLRPTPWIGDGSGTAHPIYVDDVVDHLVILATHPAAHQQIFNCTPDPAPTWREWLSAYSRLAGHDEWLALPPLLAYALAGVAMFASPRGAIGRDLPDMLAHLVTGRIVHRMTKSRELLNWQPKIDLPTGVERCAVWLRSIGLL